MRSLISAFGSDECAPSFGIRWRLRIRILLQVRVRPSPVLLCGVISITGAGTFLGRHCGSRKLRCQPQCTDVDRPGVDEPKAPRVIRAAVTSPLFQSLHLGVALLVLIVVVEKIVEEVSRLNVLLGFNSAERRRPSCQLNTRPDGNEVSCPSGSATAIEVRRQISPWRRHSMRMNA